MNDKALQIGLIGARGRMGKAIAAIESPEFRIAASFTRENPINSAAPVDLFLDVSSVAALPKNLEAALVAKKPIVIGTTGHADFDCLEAASRSIPVFYTANFSLGMALMRRAVEDLARHFHREAAVELVETHHMHKKDVPSGTALMLAQVVEKEHPSKVEIQSIRSEQIAGKHEIHFCNSEESISLIHDVQDRSAFARGAVKAAHFLAVQSPGFYTMDDLLTRHANRCKQ